MKECRSPMLEELIYCLNNKEINLNEKFLLSASAVRVLGKKKIEPGLSEQLELYGLFKQSICGDNKTPQPGFFNQIGKNKWQAWKKNEGKSKEKAKEDYINLTISLYNNKFAKTYSKSILDIKDLQTEFTTIWNTIPQNEQNNIKTDFDKAISLTMNNEIKINPAILNNSNNIPKPSK